MREINNFELVLVLPVLVQHLPTRASEQTKNESHADLSHNRGLNFIF